MLRTLELQLQLQAIFDSIKLIEGNFVRRSKGLLPNANPITKPANSPYLMMIKISLLRLPDIFMAQF